MNSPAITQTDRCQRVRCWCEDECICGAERANELLTEAEYREALETAREAESEILWARHVDAAREMAGGC